MNGGNEIRPSVSLADMIRDHQPHRVIEGHRPEYRHIVGWWRWRISTLLHRVPRALCGELLIGTPEGEGVLPDGPWCPACLQRCDRDPETDLTPVPGYRL